MRQSVAQHVGENCERDHAGFPLGAYSQVVIVEQLASNSLMPTTIRRYWPDAFNGRQALNFNWGAIGSDSVVVVTASEYVHQDDHPPAADLQRFVGDATIRVDDIVPHGPPFDANQGVSFVVIVDFPQPLFIVTDITVFDDKPVDTQAG